VDGIENAIFDSLGILDIINELFKNLTKKVPIINETVNLFEFLSDRGFDLLDVDVTENVKTNIRNWVDRVIRPSLETLIEIAIKSVLTPLQSLNLAASLVLAKMLFRLFASLVFRRPLPALNKGRLGLTIPASFFVDQIPLINPDSLEKILDFPEIVIPMKTRGFDVTVLGVKKKIGAIDWGEIHIKAPDLGIVNWNRLLDAVMLSVEVGAYFIIQSIADAWGWTAEQINEAFGKDLPLNPFDADFMPFGYFLLMATNRSFEEHKFDEMDVAEQFGNCLFMALNHTLLNHWDQRFDLVMQQLDQAPDNFPNGRDPNLWDKDFRWLRGRKHENDPQSGKLFSGLDFMCALMLAGCSDAQANRRLLREALEEALEEKSLIDAPEAPKTFYLPFRGPIVGRMQIFGPSKDLLSEDITIFVAIVFSDPGSPGKVLILSPRGGGQELKVEFSQSNPEQCVLIPLSSKGLFIESVDAGVSGLIALTPSQ
jgi:hypothetical protein